MNISMYQGSAGSRKSFKNKREEKKMKTFKASDLTGGSKTSINSNYGALIVMSLVMMITLLASSHASAWLTAMDDQIWLQDSEGIKDYSDVNDNFGKAVATGDFNGDGYMDLAVGAPGEDDEQGGVNIIYGSYNKLTPHNYAVGWWRLENANRIIRQDTYCGGTTQNAFGDKFGYSLATGDFNNDGVDDLAIGSPYRNINGESNAGAVTILYGYKDWGFLTDYYLTKYPQNKCQVWHQDQPYMYGTAEAEDLFGYSLAVGDFNYDGVDDLAIGVPGEDSSIVDVGLVNVIYGKQTSGLDPKSSSSHIGEHGLWQNYPEYGDQFGYTLAVGDFDGDDYDDLAVGVPYEDIGGSSVRDAGLVNVYYGRYYYGLKNSRNQQWYQDTLKLNVKSEKDDNFGWSLAAGNFDGDDYDDLAIGVPYEDIHDNRVSDAGLVNVLHGTTDGLAVDRAQKWHQDSSGIRGGAEEYDQFGFSLAAGNFNGDINNGIQIDDLAIGVKGEGYDGYPLKLAWGAVNVLYGTDKGLSDIEDEFWEQDTKDRRTGAKVEGKSDAFDFFGYALATGDFDDDGYADLAVGVPYEDSYYVTEFGAVNVLYGSEDDDDYSITVTGSSGW